MSEAEKIAEAVRVIRDFVGDDDVSIIQHRDACDFVIDAIADGLVEVSPAALPVHADYGLGARRSDPVGRSRRRDPVASRVMHGKKRRD